MANKLPTAYLIHPDYSAELRQEVGETFLETSDLLFSHQEIPSIWALDSFQNIQFFDFTSIKEAATYLKNQRIFWKNFSQSHFRRSQLIQENLRTPKEAPLQFLEDMAPKKVGVWGLLEANRLFYSLDPQCPVVGGKIEFHEDKKIPPSRAYLKLWELFTVYGIRPQPHEVALDMGSCPGGWSWVLSQVCKKVLSIDKAPLDPKIANIPNIEFYKKDAFKLSPQELGPIDWFFSDIICEPERLWELIHIWKPYVDNFVCTVKFKGLTDFKAMEKFQNLHPTRIRHLYNNKHEVTFVWLKNPHCKST